VRTIDCTGRSAMVAREGFVRNSQDPNDEPAEKMLEESWARRKNT
jgi:hypothetical protein